MKQLATTLACVLYFALGVFQWFATVDGIGHWLGVHWMVSVLISMFIAWIPLVGTLAGMFGAVEVWGWSWLMAGTLFFGPLVVIVLIALVGAAAEGRRK